MEKDGSDAVLDSGKFNETRLAKLQSPEVDHKMGDANPLALKTPVRNLRPLCSGTNANVMVFEGRTLSSDDSITMSKSGVEVSEKYNIIADFFDKLECSVRLLNLRRKPSIFCNISNQVEILTKRKFLPHHLAQIKYIFSEALHVEKILVLDKRTSCMMPDMKISMSFNAVEKRKNLSTSKALRQAFRARLANFVQENIDIPEAPLPEPFNCQSQIRIKTQLSTELSVQPVSSGCCFVASTLPSLENKHPLGSQNSEIPFKSTVKQEPVFTDLGKETPSRPEITPSKLLLTTPELKTPKVSKLHSPDEKTDDKAEIAIHSARKSLTFSPSKTTCDSSDPVISLNVPGSSLRCADHQMMVKSTVERGLNIESFTAKEMGGGDAPKILDDWDERAGTCQLLAGLPDFFSSIWFIFQSVDSTSITKQELVHKILFHNFEIEDAEEVEKQLKLLENLVPDWICQKTASTGDLIYCIQKACDPEAIRARLLAT